MHRKRVKEYIVFTFVYVLLGHDSKQVGYGSLRVCVAKHISLIHHLSIDTRGD